MTYSALIPFILMFICFVGIKIPLTNASFIALLSSSVITQTIFNASTEAWSRAMERTFEISVEIGLILLGAFFFLEVTKITGLIESLAKLIREISSNRVVQGVLVTFPMQMMVEGASGFGTPLLIVTPILMMLEFDLALCALLPLISCVVGVPFGALGTPMRLGFPIGSEVAHGTICLLLIFTLIGPLITAYLISKKLKLKEIVWVFLLAGTYSVSAYFISKTGPEFVALAPALLTFLVGMGSARILLQDEKPKAIRETRGLITYGLLLVAMWIGKQIFMDRLISGSNIRIFNPGFVFILFGFGLLAFYRSTDTLRVLRHTAERSKRTLIVFFCMTFVVQELRECGALTALNHGLPSFLINSGTPILGWIGAMFVGTSTVSNLLFSKVVDPVHFSALGAGAGIGVQMAFQSLAAMRSVIHDKLSEKEILFNIAPISILFMVITTASYAIFLQIGH
jgi:lactate permease